MSDFDGAAPAVTPDGQLTENGKKVVARLVASVVEERRKADNPDAFLAAWDRCFREGMASLNGGAA